MRLAREQDLGFMKMTGDRGFVFSRAPGELTRNWPAADQ
jgi:hypothetical protein